MNVDDSGIDGVGPDPVMGRKENPRIGMMKKNGHSFRESSPPSSLLFLILVI